MCFWFVFSKRCAPPFVAQSWPMKTSTYSVIWETIWLKLENRSMVLIGNLMAMPIFTDKQCVVRLLPGSCPLRTVGCAGKSGVPRCPRSTCCFLEASPLAGEAFAPAAFWATLRMLSFSKWPYELGRTLTLDSNRLRLNCDFHWPSRLLVLILCVAVSKAWRLVLRIKWSFICENLLHNTWHRAGLQQTIADLYKSIFIIKQ